MDEAEKLTSRFSHKSGIDENIGKETWRQSQSVVDLIQNHLDANTTVYERSLLGALGNITYHPDDRSQQYILKHLDRMRHSSGDQASRHYDNLLTLVPQAPPFEDLMRRLDLVLQPMPRVRLLMSDGTTKQFVEYESVAALSNEWAVVGFRVYDEGSGFDDNLLPVLGMTTKKDQSGKRGGLGEGLKVSVAHLARAGATVRLASRNADEFWIARPEIIDGDIEFNGIQKKRKDPDQTGSVTDVDFSTGYVERFFQFEIEKVLDPRLGEGLGKYILEFRGADTHPLINESCNLTQLGVKGGRIYVKGLLVMEDPDLLYSYNLGEKWAITGRDRKSVKMELVDEIILSAFDALDSYEEIIKIIRAHKDGPSRREIRLLNRLTSEMIAHPGLWKKAVADVYSFELGTCLFVSDFQSDKERFALERGYRLIRVESTAFFVHLYPGSVVVLDQLRKPEQVVATFVEAPDSKTYSEYAGLFVQMMRKSASDRNLFVPGVWNVENLRYVVDPAPQQLEQVPFKFDREHGVMLVTHPSMPMDFSTVADLYIELLKVISNRDVHDTRTQEYLTFLTTDALRSREPSVLSELELSTQAPVNQSGWEAGYSREQKLLDGELIAFCELISRLDNPHITKEEIEQVLEDLRNLRDTGMISTTHNEEYIHRLESITDRSLIGRQYLFNGVMYTVWNTWSLGVRFLSTDILTPSASFSLNLDTKPVYIANTLKEGESMELSISDHGRIYRGLIKRINGKCTYTDIGFDSQDLGVSLGSNYIHIYLDREFIYRPPGDIAISINYLHSESKPQMDEENEGKEYIEANFTIDYGGEVWTDPKRILIDALQNHVDAQKDQLPECVFTIASPQGAVRRVSTDELENCDENWKVIGVQISDRGVGYPTPYLTQIGKSTKDENDAGRFGEGLKMLCASALRQGIYVELRSRNWIARPAVHTQTIIDYEAGNEKTFDLMGYDVTWTTVESEGSQTSFSLFPIVDGVHDLNPDQREVVNQLGTDSQQLDETWAQWIQVLDPRIVNEFGEKGIGSYVLDKDRPEFIHTGKNLTLLPDRPGRIYERGLLVLKKESEVEHKKFIFGYDVDGTIINTRERNNYSRRLFDIFLLSYFSSLSDPIVMKKILEAAKRFPLYDFYEYEKVFRYGFARDQGVDAKWRGAFYEVFGENAILSLKSLGSMDGHNGRAAANEAHLENTNLVQLVSNMTSFFSNIGVISSADFVKTFENESAHILPEDAVQVDRFVERANTVICDQMGFLLSHPQAKAYLEGIVEINALETRLNELRNMEGPSVVVKHSSFNAHGLYTIVGGRPVIYLNQKLLANKSDLFATYIHEMCHHLSGRQDYEQGFQRIFMALILGASWNKAGDVSVATY